MTKINPTIRDGQTFGIKRGETYAVGHHFWIRDFIGYAADARHGHGLEGKGEGSAEVGCHVRVLEIRGNKAIVVLIRPSLPHGAAAPHGTIFSLDLDDIASWEEMFKAKKKVEDDCLYLAKRYRHVTAGEYVEPYQEPTRIPSFWDRLTATFRKAMS